MSCPSPMCRAPGRSAARPRPRAAINRDRSRAPDGCSSSSVLDRLQLARSLQLRPWAPSPGRRRGPLTDGGWARDRAPARRRPPEAAWRRDSGRRRALPAQLDSSLDRRSAGTNTEAPGRCRPERRLLTSASARLTPASTAARRRRPRARQTPAPGRPAPRRPRLAADAQGPCPRSLSKVAVPKRAALDKRYLPQHV
jgi:hypothetical protein